MCRPPMWTIRFPDIILALAPYPLWEARCYELLALAAWTSSSSSSGLGEDVTAFVLEKG